MVGERIEGIDVDGQYTSCKKKIKIFVTSDLHKTNVTAFISELI